MTSCNVSYGVPVIAKSVSFGLKSACNATFIACDPDINWFITIPLSASNTFANIWSILSLPSSLYPYPLVPFKSFSLILNSWNAFITFLLF